MSAIAQGPDNRRVELLRRFASRLEEIWLASGKPSYRDLQKLDSQLPKSTISDVLRGKTAPSDRFVRAFVRGCRRYSQNNGWHPEGAGWWDERAVFEVWRQLQRDLRALRHSGTSPESAPIRLVADEPIHDSNNAHCPTGCAAADAEVVVMRRVLDALKRMNTA